MSFNYVCERYICNPAEVTAIKAVRDGSNVRPFILYEISYNIKHVAKPHCRNSVPADAFIRPASVREKPSLRG